MSFKTYAIATIIAACSLTAGGGCCGKKSSSARSLITRLLKMAHEEATGSSASNPNVPASTPSLATPLGSTPTGASAQDSALVKQRIFDKLNAAKIVPSVPPSANRVGDTTTTSILLTKQHATVVILEYDSEAAALTMVEAFSRNDNAVSWREGRVIVMVHCTTKDHPDCVKVQQLLKS